MQALQCLVLATPGAVATGNGTSDNRTRQQSTQLQSQQQRQWASLQQQLPRLPVGHGRTVLDGQGPDQPPQDDGNAVKSASDSGTTSDNSSSNEDVISDSGGRLPDGFEEREVSFKEMREFFRLIYLNYLTPLLWNCFLENSLQMWNFFVEKNLLSHQLLAGISWAPQYMIGNKIQFIGHEWGLSPSHLGCRCKGLTF